MRCRPRSTLRSDGYVRGVSAAPRGCRAEHAERGILGTPTRKLLMDAFRCVRRFRQRRRRQSYCPFGPSAPRIYKGRKAERYALNARASVNQCFTSNLPVAYVSREPPWTLVRGDLSLASCATTRASLELPRRTVPQLGASCRWRSIASRTHPSAAVNDYGSPLTALALETCSASSRA